MGVPRYSTGVSNLEGLSMTELGDGIGDEFWLPPGGESYTGTPSDLPENFIDLDEEETILIQRAVQDYLGGSIDEVQFEQLVPESIFTNVVSQHNPEYLESSEETEEAEPSDASIVQQAADSLGGLADLTVQDLLDEIDTIIKSGVFDRDPADVLNGGFGAVWEPANSMIYNPGAGSVFVPGLPAGLPPSSVVIGTIEDLVHDPIGTLQDFGESTWQTILDTAQDPAAILDILAGADAVPDVLGGIIQGGGYSQDIVDIVESALQENILENPLMENPLIVGGQPEEEPLPFDEVLVAENPTPLEDPVGASESVLTDVQDPLGGGDQMITDDPLAGVEGGSGGDIFSGGPVNNPAELTPISQTDPMITQNPLSGSSFGGSGGGSLTGGDATPFMASIGIQAPATFQPNFLRGNSLQNVTMLTNRILQGK